MLRILYGLILRAHPPYFRKRFEQEMLCIFELAETPRDEIGMLADVLVSLGRQWTLRPRFWEEPTVAGQAGLLFSSLESNKPRTAALLYGALLSALVLNGVCWTMGYAWNHPIFIELRRPVIVPPAAWNTKAKNTAAPEATETVEPELYTNQGRVVLIFTTHAHAARASSPENTSSIPAGHPLHSYAGTYIASPGQQRVNVSLADGGLQVEVVGVFSGRLVPSANSNSLVCIAKDCQVSFSTGAGGSVDGIHIRYGGKDVQAFRLQGATF